jgi:putative endonuclease
MAADHLAAAGWSILARNWRDGPRELDLVVYREGVLAFVEVKTRRGDRCGLPLEGITWRKRREVERAAAAWLTVGGHQLPHLNAIRFDAVAVRLPPNSREGEAEVHHLEDAWWGGE